MEKKETPEEWVRRMKAIYTRLFMQDQLVKDSLDEEARERLEK